MFATRTRAEWIALLGGDDTCIAPVLDWDEAPADPHNVARGTFVEIDGVTQPGPAPRFGRTPAPVPKSARISGNDTGAVLEKWGVPPGVIGRLLPPG
jgi:alpha-methylacyl-CoA racemase